MRVSSKTDHSVYPKRSKFVKVRVEIGENKRLKTTLSLALRPLLNGTRSVPHGYNLESFFLFPGVHEFEDSEVSPETFYSNMTSYIRFREPKLTYRELVGGGKAKGSSLELIEAYLNDAVEGRLVEPPEAIVAEMRYFGATFSRYCYRKIEKKFERLEKASDARRDEVGHKYAENVNYVEKARSILKSWRNLLTLVNNLPNDFLDVLKEEYQKVDEYCSYVFRDALLQGLRCVDKFPQFFAFVIYVRI